MGKGAKISLPCTASSALLAVTTCLPLAMEAIKTSLASVVPPITSTRTTMEEATFLTNFASEVVVVHRRDALRASRVMAERALNNPKISFEWNATVEEVLGDEAVAGFRGRLRLVVG